MESEGIVLVVSEQQEKLRDVKQEPKTRFKEDSRWEEGGRPRSEPWETPVVVVVSTKSSSSLQSVKFSPMIRTKKTKQEKWEVMMLFVFTALSNIQGFFFLPNNSINGHSFCKTG